MEFKKFWKIYAGLFVIFGLSFYLSLGGETITPRTKLKDLDGYSDFELAEAAKLSKNRLDLSDIADEGSQKALGSSRKGPDLEVEGNDENPDDVPQNGPYGQIKKNDKDDCGSFKNLNCVPTEDENKANLSPSRPVNSANNGDDDNELIKAASKTPKNRTLQGSQDESGRKKNWQDDEARKNALISMGSGQTQTIKAESAIVSNDKYIKKGSKYYGFIDERIALYKGGEPQFLNIYITGQASPSATRKAFALYAKATWSQNGISIEVLDCLSIDPRKLSIPCKAQVSDVIHGGTGLDAKVYNPSVWGKVFQIAANVMAGSHLDQITQTIAPSGQILSFASSNRVQRALSDAWIEAGKEARSMYTGDRAEAPAGAIVKILIKSDVRLW
jgi:hypothetical protein